MKHRRHRNEFIKKLNDLIRAEAPINEAAIEEIFQGQGHLPFSANVSRKTWVDDFLGLAQKDRSNQAIFHYLLERHGPQDWLAEYHVRLCNALCYMDEKMQEFEEACLASTSPPRPYISGNLPWALYSHFAACDASMCHVFDLVPLKKIIAQARGCDV
jgi:hypothetical protein